MLFIIHLCATGVKAQLPVPESAYTRNHETSLVELTNYSAEHVPMGSASQQHHTKPSIPRGHIAHLTVAQPGTITNWHTFSGKHFYTKPKS